MSLGIGMEGMDEIGSETVFSTFFGDCVERVGVLFFFDKDGTLRHFWATARRRKACFLYT